MREPARSSLLQNCINPTLVVKAFDKTSDSGDLSLLERERERERKREREKENLPTFFSIYRCHTKSRLLVGALAFCMVYN